MSNRSLIEMNHDYVPDGDDAALLAWARKLRTYLRSGTGTELPTGVTLFWRRNSGDPCPFENPLDFERRYGRLARTLQKHQ